MKIRKISILLAVSLGAIITFPGCEKDDGGIPKRVTITEVPTITTNIDATASTIINILTPATATTFAGKFKVDLYFPGSTPPSKVDIVVRKNNFNPIINPSGLVTNSNVKLYKANVTTLPTTFTVTAAEIASLFGVPIGTWDVFDFAPDIYVGDRKFEAFPAVANGTGTGLSAQPFFSEFARYTALCVDPNFHDGNFEVVADSLHNFVPGQVVTLKKISSTQFSFVDPFVTFTPPTPIPIVVSINGLNQLSINPKQKIGNAFTWNLSYTNPNMQVSVGPTNYIDPCGKLIELNITYSVDQLILGIYLLKLRKL